MQAILSYFEHTYIRDRLRPGRGEDYGQALFPIEDWNLYENPSEGLGRTRNSVVGWYYRLQALFQCYHSI